MAGKINTITQVTNVISIKKNRTGYRYIVLYNVFHIKLDATAQNKFFQISVFC